MMAYLKKKKQKKMKYYIGTLSYVKNTSSDYFVIIYIYIYCHPQTDCFFYHNSSVWLNMQDSSSWDQNPPNFMLDLVSYRSAI